MLAAALGAVRSRDQWLRVWLVIQCAEDAAVASACCELLSGERGVTAAKPFAEQSY